MESTSKRYYCGHCDQEVSRTTLYSHKRLYYNRTRREWSKARVSYPTAADTDSTCSGLEETEESSGSDAEILESDHCTIESEQGGVRNL